MDIKDRLVEIIQKRSAGVFLFVGSGFSRRYLGLEDWKGLLNRFCVTEKPFEYYLSTANSDLPKVAKLLAEDFHETWWKEPKYNAIEKKNKYELVDKTSALRIEISEYLREINESALNFQNYSEELHCLKELDVDGIITTNWDLLPEILFPDYKVYVGQDQLVFSNPQNIAEIYKIHGCSSNPSSLILTDDDYLDFNYRNAYLAAKLITHFMEHPIVFIGYSLADKNIQGILKAIAQCVRKNNIDKLRNNLIFIQRLRIDDRESISESFIAVDDIQIPIVSIKTNDFSKVYKAIKEKKRQIPSKIFRLCKEQLYELVQSCEPETKMCVVDLETIDTKDDIEFVVGVGVASAKEKSIAEKGYCSIKVEDIFHNLLFQDSNYDPELILTQLIPNIKKNYKFLPVFQFLHKLSIVDKEKYKQSKINLDKWIVTEIKDLQVNSYFKSFNRNYKDMSLVDIIASLSPEKAAMYIPFIDKEDIDLDILCKFLITNEAHFISDKSSYASYFRKIACLYDKLKYGW